MSATGSARSGDTTELLQPELTQDSSSEESFVFHRELTSDHDRYSIQDLNPENTFVADSDESPNVHRQLTFDKDFEDSNAGEREIELDHSGKTESDIGKDSTSAGVKGDGGVALGLLSEKTECLMSEHEIAEWDQRMDELVERFQKQQEEYEKWENNLNKRRLIAYERLKKLKACHTRRLDLYNAVTGYIGDINSELHGKTV